MGSDFVRAAEVDVKSFPRCAASTSVRSACVGVVDDLYARWDLPSVYLLVDGRLRCQASRGYFQVSDGFTTSTGVIGRVVSSGIGEVIHDVTGDPSFVAAVPGLRAEVCLPVRVFGVVVGVVNIESRGLLGSEVAPDVERAAMFLGRRLEVLCGLPVASPAQRLARIAVDMASQTGLAQVRRRAVRGAQEISGMSSAALAYRADDGWVITHAAGPFARVMRSWDGPVLEILSGRVRDKTSSYFSPAENVPIGFEFLPREVRALSVQPLIVTGKVVGLLITADGEAAAHDPALTTAMELLATQTVAMLAMTCTMEALSREATRDPLTGLLNRRRLLQHLQTAAGVEGAALLLLDLDGFKAVNDRHGHAQGDAVLQDVAQRLTCAAREDDLIFRLGGDEFAVLVHGVDSPAAAAALGARFMTAATYSDRHVDRPRIGASAGVRLLTGEPASSALFDADVALYSAKRSGRGRTVVWQPSLRRDELEQEALLSDLRHALRASALTLEYQPVVDLRSLRVRGLEALARWHHPVRGQVPPSLFVQLAEQTGMARELSCWVLRTAFTEAVSWSPSPDGDRLKIAVNLSAVQLADERVVYDVRTALAQTRLAPDRVVLEVTETAHWPISPRRRPFSEPSPPLVARWHSMTSAPATPA